ncbi:GM23245 [Drosophila sechellia]|uniref:GM23245 n=1 Tax=Drosophila sechellia TaxID=7238 RepID=B4IMI2_DROSE|nr:GM23245 [Drosophila sechellia]
MTFKDDEIGILYYPFAAVRTAVVCAMPAALKVGDQPVGPASFGKVFPPGAFNGSFNRVCDRGDRVQRRQSFPESVLVWRGLSSQSLLLRRAWPRSPYRRPCQSCPAGRWAA